MADVMGKGLPAALLANMLRTNLHAIVASQVDAPGEIIAKTNALMIRDLIKLEMFITMTCVWISPDRSQIRHASAGHLASLLQKSEGEILQIDGAGMPVGIFHDSVYASYSTPFLPGDRLLLYTDGIVEASAADGSMFELEGVKGCLARSRPLSSRGTIDKMLNEVALFSGKEAPSDDRPAVLISRTN